MSTGEFPRPAERCAAFSKRCLEALIRSRKSRDPATIFTFSNAPARTLLAPHLAAAPLSVNPAHRACSASGHAQVSLMKMDGGVSRSTNQPGTSCAHSATIPSSSSSSPSPTKPYCRLSCNPTCPCVFLASFVQQAVNLWVA